MGRALAGLLKSYEFLLGARRLHSARLSPTDAQSLEDRIDRVFLDIVTLESDDPRITAAQARFLMSSLADLIPQCDKRNVLRTMCQKHLDRLAVQLVKPKADRSEPDSLQYRYLDSLRDRVAVVDTEYRYVFTNKANADFHGTDARTFVGRPNWQIIGTKYFELFNKPRFDACFAGRPDSFITAHPLGGPTDIHAVNMDPVLDEAGDITSIMITCRNVSNLPIPAEMIVPAP